MSSKFNKYIFYIDSTRQTVNFDSLDEVNEYVCDMTGVSQDQVVIVDDVEWKKIPIDILNKPVKYAYMFATTMKDGNYHITITVK